MFIKYRLIKWKSKYLFANKKIYNWITEIKINKKIVNKASKNIKNIHGVVNIEKHFLVKSLLLLAGWCNTYF